MERTKTDWLAKLSLWMSGFEIIAAPVAVMWNHHVTHAGGWEDLARGIIDLLIWMGVMLCSLLFGAIAFVRRVKCRNTASINLRQATWACILHGAVLIVGLAMLWPIFANDG